MTTDLTLRGTLVAMVTPFAANGAVDFDALDRLTDDLIAGGVQGLVPCGTTGESPTLSHEEQDDVTARVVRRTAGRVPVVAGTGSNSTDEAVRLTRHAKDAGADGCLVVNPYYNKPTQDGMLRHLEAIDAVGLPIVLYNHPGRTGMTLEVETVARAYDTFENVVATKEASGKLDVVSALVARCGITVLSGDDPLTLPIMACGGAGVISVIGNILPGEIRRLTDAMLAGDLPAARAQQARLMPLYDTMFAQTNPIPIKAAMAMAGRMRPDMRLPMTELSDRHRPRLAAALRAFGVDVRD
ncbi:MAG: 4-hydroxy-tetrahydrodipicolinate synthase [Planctomycetes bacterium]|nr:4-hydroxy-tetrahydrodipicolinate synthase [Planctomycetota bacterium]